MKLHIKLILVTLAFPILLLIGGIMVRLSMVRNFSPTMTIVVPLIGIIWAIVCILGLIRWTEYWKMWHDVLADRQKRTMPKTRERCPEYKALYDKYPLAITRHERHYRHQDRYYSNSSIVSMALMIDEQEWQSREKYQRMREDENDADGMKDQNMVRMDSSMRSHV